MAIRLSVLSISQGNTSLRLRLGTVRLETALWGRYTNTGTPLFRDRPTCIQGTLMLPSG
jgi:hypothetical protein